MSLQQLAEHPGPGARRATAGRYRRTASRSRSRFPARNRTSSPAMRSSGCRRSGWPTRRSSCPSSSCSPALPGAPSDWTRAAMADVTAREFADAHHGHGADHRDARRERLVQRRHRMRRTARAGNAETYLTVDVPNFMRTHFNASKSGKGSVAIAGLSEGGMCALMLTLRHPDEYPAFADYSGLTSPTVSEAVDPPRPSGALRRLAGGLQPARPAVPATPAEVPEDRRLVRGRAPPTARHSPPSARSFRSPRSAGILTCCREVPGEGHDFTLWERRVPRFAAVPVLAARPDAEAQRSSRATAQADGSRQACLT